MIVLLLSLLLSLAQAAPLPDIALSPFVGEQVEVKTEDGGSTVGTLVAFDELTIVLSKPGGEVVMLHREDAVGLRLDDTSIASPPATVPAASAAQPRGEDLVDDLLDADDFAEPAPRPATLGPSAVPPQFQLSEVEAQRLAEKLRRGHLTALNGVGWGCLLVAWVPTMWWGMDENPYSLYSTGRLLNATFAVGGGVLSGMSWAQNPGGARRVADGDLSGAIEVSRQQAQSGFVVGGIFLGLGFAIRTVPFFMSDPSSSMLVYGLSGSAASFLIGSGIGTMAIGTPLLFGDAGRIEDAVSRLSLTPMRVQGGSGLALSGSF